MDLPAPPGALTMMVVSATGNHWWLDGIVAIVLVVIAIAIDTGARRLIAPPGAVVETLDAEPPSPTH